jgi:CRP-like cAMP-binding protein
MNHVSFLQMTSASCDKLSSRLMLESIGASELVVQRGESLDTALIVLTGSATVLRPAAASIATTAAAAATVSSSGGDTGAAVEATEAEAAAAAAESLVRAGTLQPGDVFGMQVL